jgi:cytochrome c-type biogenesis protein CcmE
VLGTRRRKIVAGLVIAGAVAFLLVQGLANATEYYKTVPQAVAQRASLGTKQFRIMGEVGPTIERTATGYSFFITYDGVRADVVDTDQPSQLFKSGVPVVLEGHWAGTVFMSDLIMVKHSNNYTPPTDPAARSGSGAGS